MSEPCFPHSIIYQEIHPKSNAYASLFLTVMCHCVTVSPFKLFFTKEHHLCPVWAIISKAVLFLGYTS